MYWTGGTSPQPIVLTCAERWPSSGLKEVLEDVELEVELDVLEDVELEVELEVLEDVELEVEEEVLDDVELVVVPSNSPP